LITDRVVKIENGVVAVNKKRIGIFGGAGYIGSSIAEFLVGSYDVVILDVKEFCSASKGVEFRKCDIRKLEEVTDSVRDCDAVIDAAIIQIPAINEQKRLGYEVNYLGTQNICEAVHQTPRVRGLILAGSWHTVGERKLTGLINEEFGFRPDMVEERARLYALSKIAQESIVRYYSEMSEKIFGIIRMGTVLGEGMPEKTAANIFIEHGLKGLSITPYKHSMYRPMLYVDILDICRAYNSFVSKILSGAVSKSNNSLDLIVNVYYPKPITIRDLAAIVQEIIRIETENRVSPPIEIVDVQEPMMFAEDDKTRIVVDTSKAMKFLGMNNFKSPRESIQGIVRNRLGRKER
jgi:nucleoside-diphosphate-sugar epimerase